MEDPDTRYFSGNCVYGDDFTPDQIAAWYAEEEEGYHKLTSSYGYKYDGTGWSAVYRRHFFRFLPAGSSFSRCVALGCADGSDVAPLAPFVSEFLAIEPSESWWRREIGGTKATYLKPMMSGDMLITDRSVDIAISFGTLHHIPNPSYVIREIGRILKPGALFLLREPNYSMGDWRKPRHGLTKNERGFPEDWLDRTLSEAGFSFIRKSSCSFPLAARLAERVGLKEPYASDAYVAIDAALSRLFAARRKYHRTSILDKIAPTSACRILKRNH